MVLNRSLAATQLGLVPVATGSAWFEHYVKAYVTADDYLADAMSARGVSFDPVPLITSCFGYIPAMSTCRCWLAHVYQDRFLTKMNPGMADRVRRVLEGTADGIRRALLARQPVLRAMREVLTHRSLAGSESGYLHAMAPRLDPELAAMLLVHLVATQLRAPRTAGERTIGGIPEGLAMDMLANGLFHTSERPDVLLARTRMLWSTYGAQVDLGKLKLRARPLDLLREATGLSFEDIAALTVAYYGYIRALEPGGLPGVNAFAGIAVGRETVETYLSLFASTPGELAARLDACPGRGSFCRSRSAPCYGSAR